MTHQNPHKKNGGQALVEFALIMPIVLLLIFGIIDFSRIFIAYATASGALREASRYAATVGYTSVRFRDCDAIRAEAENAFFLSSQVVTIEYVDANTLAATVCPDTPGIDEYSGDLDTNDILQITSNNSITPWTPIIAQMFPNISMNFVARRTIVEEIEIGSANTSEDSDSDGLLDAWEEENFGTPLNPDDDLHLSQNATDDPDGDGCNNGCEEVMGTDPNNEDTDGDGISDYDEIFILGTDPLDPDDPADTVLAVDDTESILINEVITINVLANDNANSATIEIVSGSLTTPSLGGTVTINNNGTIGDTTDDYLDYIPPSGTTGTDTFDYTITDTTTQTDTATVSIIITAPPPTAMPEPTPVDIAHTTFVDVVSTSNEDYWRFNYGRVWVGSDPWDVEYWNGTATSGTQAETLMASTACTSTLPFDQPIAFDWGGDGPSDCSVGTNGFAIRWSRTFGWDCDDADGITENDCANYPDYPNLEVDLTTIANDEMRVKINDSVVIDWGSGGTASYNFVAGTEYDIEVEYYENSGDAVAAFIVNDGVNSDDVGICNWSQSTEESPISPLYSLSDSPGQNYSLNSLCYLELRGTVDLSGMGTTPHLTFWDKWNLAATDNTRIEVREAGGSTWPYSETIHTGASSQTVWQQQEIELYNFDLQNFTGKTIEFRFVLETDGSANEDGWWIDNIVIDEDAVKTYEIPFADDVESVNEYWTLDTGWATVSDPVREGFGAWSAPTVNGSSSMQLNGEFIMPSDNGLHPELVFYHQYNLGINEAVYVEIADTDDFASPVQLTGGPIQSVGSNGSFERVAIPLDAYWDDSFYLRFRIESDGSGGDWYIDDITIDYRDDTTLPYPFYDNMDTVNDYWSVNAQWAISTLEEDTRNNSGGAWSDSIGENYTDGTNPSFQTARQIDMTGASSPVLSFWHKRSLAATDSFIVEVSTDYGSNWTAVWDYTYNTAYTSSDGTSADQFNTQLAWERVAIDMSDYIDDLILLRFRLDATTNSAVGDGVLIDDILLGEYSVTNYEDSDNDGVAFYSNMGNLVNSNYNPADGTANQYPDWHIGGIWGVETGHDGNAVSDSPTGDYATNTWSVLELADPIVVPAIDGDQFPVLSWWDKVALANGDYARVQVSRQNSATWNDWGAWTNVQSSGAPSTEALPHDYNTGHSWNFRQVDLSDYAGSTIRLRFVLDALQDSSTPDTNDGWLIDDVKVALYYDPADDLSMAEFNSVSADINNWHQEGTWGIEAIDITTPGVVTPVDVTWGAAFYSLDQLVKSSYPDCNYFKVNSNRALTTAEMANNAVTLQKFESIYSGGCKNNTFSARGTEEFTNLDLTCAAGELPSPDDGVGCSSDVTWKDDSTAAEHIAIRFDTTVTVENDKPYTLTIACIGSDQGLRVYDEGILVLDWWETSCTDPATLTVSGNGDHDLIIDYYYNETGTVTIQADMTEVSDPVTTSVPMFHDSPGDDYEALDDMALQLDGIIDLSGVATPVLTWTDRYAISGPACIYPEISLPYVAFDKWLSIADTAYMDPDYTDTAANPFNGCTADGTIGSPVTRTADLKLALNANGIFDFSNLKIAVRFRLDARTAQSSTVNDGWWINDITVADTNMVLGVDEDQDLDGLSNEDEINQKYGYATDWQNWDTDGDTLGDWIEIIYYHSDPTMIDTDGDGIDDDEEVDEGLDGYVTDPNKSDTDGDGIDDPDEINTVLTDPNDPDSDDDLLSDWQETDSSSYFSGSDPLVATTNITGEIVTSWDPLSNLIGSYVTNGRNAAAARTENEADLNVRVADNHVGVEFSCTTTCDSGAANQALAILTAINSTLYTEANSEFVDNGTGGSFYIAVEDIQEYLWRASAESALDQAWAMTP